MSIWSIYVYYCSVDLQLYFYTMDRHSEQYSFIAIDIFPRKPYSSLYLILLTNLFLLIFSPLKKFFRLHHLLYSKFCLNIKGATIREHTSKTFIGKCKNIYTATSNIQRWTEIFPIFQVLVLFGFVACCSGAALYVSLYVF